MTSSTEIVIADAHAHASPKGLGGLEVCRRFRESGGWFIALVSLPPSHYGLGNDLDSLIRSFELHVRECVKGRETGVRVACIAGIHPAYVDRIVKEAGPQKAYDVVARLGEALKVLQKYLREGLIDGLGEFGRPHFRTLPESFIANEILMDKALTIAKDEGCVIHLHLEQAGQLTVESIRSKVLSLGVSPVKVILHHSSLSMVSAAEAAGLSTTITCRHEAVVKALERGLAGFMCESDYIDDPKRPGVVMYPWNIREEMLKALDILQASGSAIDLNAEELTHRVMVDNICKVYGIPPP